MANGPERPGPGVRAEPLAALLTLWSLTRSTWTLWRLTFFSIGGWFCLGFAVHVLCLLLSAQLGAEHGVLALVAFVVGVVATLVALVLMIHSVEPHLRSLKGTGDAVTLPGTGESATLSSLRIPGKVFVRERAVDVVATAVGPFLAVYAVWGFVDDQVRELFFSNITVQGLGGAKNFSISFDPARLGFYAAAAGIAWVVRQVLSALTARGRRRPLALLGILAEAMWVFSIFAAAFIVLQSARAWMRNRAVWVGLQDGWQQVLGQLPDWSLPFGLTLPQALDRAVSALVDTVLPGAWQAVALPLVWLALTATVLGWREFGGGEVLTGTRLRASHLAGSPRRTRTALAMLTGELRTKYLPVLQALRLIGHAGARFVGVYLVLATVLTAAQRGFDIALTVLLGPRDVGPSLLTDGFATLLSGLIFTPLAIALYAAAFDVALGALVRQGTDVSDGPRPDSDRPSTVASGSDRRTAPG